MVFINEKCNPAFHRFFFNHSITHVFIYQNEKSRICLYIRSNKSYFINIISSKDLLINKLGMSTILFNVLPVFIFFIIAIIVLFLASQNIKLINDIQELISNSPHAMLFSFMTATVFAQTNERPNFSVGIRSQESVEESCQVLKQRSNKIPNNTDQSIPDVMAYCTMADTV